MIPQFRGSALAGVQHIAFSGQIFLNFSDNFLDGNDIYDLMRNVETTYLALLTADNTWKKLCL